jgi:type VII secretion integral membrane protein EccD
MDNQLIDGHVWGEPIVATVTSAGFSRVTIVAPMTRVDLALPDDIPFADMLPTLLRYAGDGLADDPNAREGWALSRLSGGVLDSSRTPGQLEIRDGEFLYLRPRGAEPPELAFDDVVDAVATATNERAGRWRPGATRVFGLWLSIVALVGGAIAILFSGPPDLIGGVVGIGAGVALLLTATVLSRAFGQSPTGSVFALLALLYIAVGGVLISAGDLSITKIGAPHLLIAAALVFLAAAIAVVAVAHRGSVFLSAGVVSGALLVAALICFATGAPATGGAAVLAAFAFAWLPMLPMLAYRLARLPIPSVPSGPDDLRTDQESVDGARVLARSERADEFLAALLGALAFIGFACGLVLATGGLSGVILALVLGLLMVTRARWFISRRQRLPLLIAGAATLGVTLAGVYLVGNQAIRLILVPATLVVTAGFGAAMALTTAERRRSPVAGRMLDIFEVLLIVAIIPLAVWASGLLGWVRSING